MTLNPEFRRYLTLELTPHRLVAVPLILGLIFATAWAIDGAEATAWTGRLLMIVLLVLWGARTAADAVFSEVADRTWDAQRMSSIGPWAMTWGKLFGSTVFSWYCALCCAPAVLVDPADPVETLVEIVLFGLFAHAMALLISLLLLQVRPRRTRFQVNIAHVGGILIALAFGGVGTDQTDRPFAAVDWYGVAMSLGDFALLTQVVFLAWTVIGVYRLMRLELQFKPQPVVWLSFVLFVAAYVGGVSLDFDGKKALALGPPLAAAVHLAAGLAFVLLLTYCTAFLAPSGGVHLRRLFWSLRAGAYYRAFQAAPPWLIAMAVALVLATAVGVLMTLAPEDVARVYDRVAPAPDDLARALRILGDVDPLARAILALVALMMFVLRDLALIQFVILSPRARRGHLAAVMYLAVLYAGIPTLLSSVGMKAALPAFLPVFVDKPALLLPVLLQLGLVGLGLVWRWRRIAVAYADAPAPAE